MMKEYRESIIFNVIVQFNGKMIGFGLNHNFKIGRILFNDFNLKNEYNKKYTSDIKMQSNSHLFCRSNDTLRKHD